MKKVFLFKENGTYDRDCVKYIDKELRLGKTLEGNCFYTEMKELTEKEFNNLTCILSYDEYNKLLNYTDENISKEEIIQILNKLNSKENKELFNKVIEEEKEYIKYEYNLDNEDIEEIFNNNTSEYMDRSIIICMYDDVKDLAYNKLFNDGVINNYNETLFDEYFDYEDYGQDLIEEDDCYLKLSDGRIVYYNI